MSFPALGALPRQHTCHADWYARSHDFLSPPAARDVLPPPRAAPRLRARARRPRPTRVSSGRLRDRLGDHIARAEATRLLRQDHDEEDDPQDVTELGLEIVVALLPKPPPARPPRRGARGGSSRWCSGESGPSAPGPAEQREERGQLRLQGSRFRRGTGSFAASTGDASSGLDARGSTIRCSARARGAGRPGSSAARRACLAARRFRLR